MHHYSCIVSYRIVSLNSSSVRPTLPCRRHGVPCYSASLVPIFACLHAYIYLLPLEDQGRPKGFAFITMENADDAEEAMRKLTGTQIDGRDIRVSIK